MVSVGKAHRCPPAQSPATKLQIRWVSCSSGEMECILDENEIVDAGIDDEAIAIQRPNVVPVGCGPTKLKVEHRVASGRAQRRTWYDACMSTWNRWKT